MNTPRTHNPRPDMSDFVPLHHVIGARALVVIAVPGTADLNENIPCEVVGSQSADDRPYRLIVRLNNGKEIGPCAPECVLPLPIQYNLDIA